MAFRKGGFGGGKGGFRPRFGGQNDRGPRGEMFSATCASCGNQCEVPFRPTGERPVYCKECFRENGGGMPQGGYGRPQHDDRGPKRFPPRREFGPAPRRFDAPTSDRSLEEVKQQLRALETKLDAIMRLVSGVPASAKAPAAVVEQPVKVAVPGTDAADASAKKPVKKVAKKAAAKKAK